MNDGANPRNIAAPLICELQFSGVVLAESKSVWLAHDDHVLYGCAGVKEESRAGERSSLMLTQPYIQFQP